MSHIYEALKKLDRETSSKRLGWGPIGKEILKPGPPSPRKRISSYLIPVLLTAVATAASIYGVTLTSDLLRKSPSLAPKISPAPGPQVAQIPPGVAEAAKTLPPSPDAQGSKTPPSAAETTKILPPEPSKSPAPIQKIAPPSPPEAGSLQKSSPSIPPRYGGPDRKGAPAPLASGPPTKVPSLPPVQPPPNVPARKSTPLPLASGSPTKAPSLPRVQPPSTEEDDSEGHPQTIQERASPNLPPQITVDAEKIRQQREEQLEKLKQWREALKQQRAGYQGNLPFERKNPVPPATEGIASPPIIPRVSEVLPGASPQAAAQPPKIPDGSLPRLKISGIVWHEQPAMRRAVINGSFASEGSQIEGVKVVEILPTRVRFSYKNQVFELSAFE
jgi:hypothetical protein